MCFGLVFKSKEGGRTRRVERNLLNHSKHKPRPPAFKAYTQKQGPHKPFLCKKSRNRGFKPLCAALALCLTRRRGRGGFAPHQFIWHLPPLVCRGAPSAHLGQIRPTLPPPAVKHVKHVKQGMARGFSLLSGPSRARMWRYSFLYNACPREGIYLKLSLALHALQQTGANR